MTSGETVDAMSGIDQVPDIALFDVAGRAITATGLVGIAATDGRWDPVIGRAARGVGALAVSPPPLEAVTAAERSFRYERGLVAAEDVERWLEQFALSVSDWRDHVRRDVALERRPDSAPGEAVPAQVWATACATELLELLARDQARRLVAALSLREETETPGPEVVERFLAEAVDDAQIDREIGDNGMRWLRVRYSVLTAPNEDAAAEARLCITEDGMAAAEVGVLLGSPVLEHDGWLGDAPADLADPLLTTAVGDVASPLPRDIGVDVVAVHARAQLPPDAPELRAAVRDVLAERALRRQVEDRVRWHVRF